VLQELAHLKSLQLAVWPCRDAPQAGRFAHGPGTCRGRADAITAARCRLDVCPGAWRLVSVGGDRWVVVNRCLSYSQRYDRVLYAVSNIGGQAFTLSQPNREPDVALADFRRVLRLRERRTAFLPTSYLRFRGHPRPVPIRACLWPRCRCK